MTTIQIIKLTPTDEPDQIYYYLATTYASPIPDTLKCSLEDTLKELPKVLKEIKDNHPDQEIITSIII